MTPSLVFGDVNVLVLTDVHSWAAGHGRHEPDFDADYGVVLSFYERLKEYLDETGKDLWFVNNGDFVHGTGLSKVGDPSSLIPLIQKIPFDIVSCGNHELYHDEAIEYMTRPGGWVDWWGERYITSNIFRANEDPSKDPPRPLGNYYRVLKGKNSNLLVLGFLYNMEDAGQLVDVHKVEDVVQSAWFLEVASRATGETAIDAILVMAHMDLIDPLVDVIRTALRKIAGDEMPIQFITGHTHYRGVEKLDNWSTSFEAGNYLDTVGFVSFPTKSTVSSGKVNETENVFQTVFLDGNKKVLATVLGLDDEKDLQTENGKELSEFIDNTRLKMGLMEEIGCAPHDYLMNVSLYDKQSLWGLYRDSVIPKTFFADNEDDSIMFLSKNSWRYDLLSNKNLIVDDIVAVAPFNDTVVYIGQVSGRAILQLNVTMNENPDPYLAILPNFILIGAIDNDKKMYRLYTHDFNEKDFLQALAEIVPDKSFSPERTEFSSTMLWLSFVGDYWPCNGIFTSLPGWVPTPDVIAKRLGQENADGTNKLSIFMLTVLGITGLIALRFLYKALRRCFFCCIEAMFLGFAPLSQQDDTELESTSEEDDGMGSVEDKGGYHDEDFINDVDGDYDSDDSVEVASRENLPGLV